MRIVVVGDLHTQEAKLWRMLDEAGLRTPEGTPSEELSQDRTRLILLGDLVHAKSRERYAEIAGVHRYDEFDPGHLRRAEQAQEAFLRRVRAYVDAAPAGAVTILLGNHDHNALDAEQGPLRSDDISHLEWKPGHGAPLPADLRGWIATWPREREIEGIHFAHVGPLEQHNVYDTGFYLENRRRWIYEDEDLIASSPYRLGVYGHTPVRGGLNLASRGRALLLDANGHAGEYAWLEVLVHEADYRVRLRGLVFDEVLER